jgi:hypothetical protein
MSDDTIRYIGQLAGELKKIAEAYGYRDIAYLLEIAHSETLEEIKRQGKQEKVQRIKRSA